MEVVFISGFPSPRARHLAQLILEEEPETEVWLLVAEDELAQAAAEVDRWSSRRRVRMLEGDPAGLDFGLSGREYGELAEAVTLIHHLGGLRRHRQGTKGRRRRSLCGGAQEAIELSRASSGARLVHHSTAFVSGDRSGTIFEDELDRAQGFFGPTQEIMARVEAQLRREMRGLDVLVLRPTLLVGDAGSTLEAGPSLLVMLAQGFPGLTLPRPTARLDLVPIDHAMRAAHRIARTDGAGGKTYHITSGAPQTAERVFSFIAAEVGDSKHTHKPSLSAGAAEVLLRTPGLERVLGEARTLLMQLGTGAVYDARNAERILGPAGLSCPALEDHLPGWIQQVQRRLEAG